MLAATEASDIKADLHAFGQCLSQKWQNTCQKNLLSEVCGPQGLWKQAVVLHPFLKWSQSHDLSNFPKMIELVTDLPSIRDEFTQYLVEAPSNPEVGILEYWKSASVLYPNLAKAALQLPCISYGSVDAERSFSKMRNVQHPTRTSMNLQTLCLQMTVL